MTPDFDPEAFQLQNDTSLAGVLRCLKAKRLRELGVDNVTISNACGIPLRLVQVAIDAADQRHPDEDPEDLTTAMDFKMREWMDGAEQIFREPGFRHDVKGDLMVGPNGEPEIDTERQIQALREQMRLAEGVRKLRGIDAPVRRHLTVEEVNRKQDVRMLVERLRMPAEALAQLEVVEGEIVYEGSRSEMLIGDGGAVEGEEGTDPVSDDPHNLQLGDGGVVEDPDDVYLGDGGVVDRPGRPGKRVDETGENEGSP